LGRKNSLFARKSRSLAQRARARAKTPPVA
jgi:hypothetical protein